MKTPDTDSLLELLQVILRNPMRAAFSGLGVGWGLFMIIITVGSARGLENGIKSEMDGRAPNSMFAWTMPTSMAYKGFQRRRYPGLNFGDLEWLQENSQHLELVAPEVQLGGYEGSNAILHGSKSGAFTVKGSISRYRELKPMRMLEGRFVNEGDQKNKQKVCVIGSRVHQVLYDKDEPVIGSTIEIVGIAFTVVGIYTPIATGEDAKEEAEMIYVPLTTFAKSFHRGDRVDWISALVRDDVDPGEAEKATVALIKLRKNIHPDDPRAVGSWSMAVEFQKSATLFSAMRLVSLIFGGLALLAGVIGITNIMLISIKERTKEIGIRRSIGATPLRVIRQILGETVVLTTLSGLLGMVAGVMTLELVDSLVGDGGEGGVFRHPEIDFNTVLTVLAILLVMALIAGVLPAIRAVAIRPVQAIQNN
jgi:putative ABC transport system permease protein